MSKKPISPKWTTTVDPSEYDYVGQFTQVVKWANRDEACFMGMDVGKVWGLVQLHQRLKAENAALRADKERLDWLDSCANYQIESNLLRWSFFTPSSMDDIRAAIDAARKEGK